MNCVRLIFLLVLSRSILFAQQTGSLPVQTGLVIGPALAGTDPKQSRAADLAILKLVSNLDKLTRVTEERIVLRNVSTTVCAGIDLPDHSRLVGKRDISLHVYVTPSAAAVFKDADTRFPVGTVILKEKFRTTDGADVDFYTGMLKREPGFNPLCGNWEFFTMSGDRKAVTARGRIESCMDCHNQYAKTDFVTKRIK